MFAETVPRNSDMNGSWCSNLLCSMVPTMMSLAWLLSHQQLSTFAYARQIIKKEGLGIQGLNKGLTATLGRHGIFNMVYFGFYHNVKNIIPASMVTI